MSPALIMSGAFVDAVRQETDVAFSGFQSEYSASLSIFDANNVPKHTVCWAGDVSIIVILDVNWRFHVESIHKVASQSNGPASGSLQFCSTTCMIMLVFLLFYHIIIILTK